MRISVTAVFIRCLVALHLVARQAADVATQQAADEMAEVHTAVGYGSIRETSHPVCVLNTDSFVAYSMTHMVTNVVYRE